MTRDTGNAVALGMTVGQFLGMNIEEQRPKAWRDIGWDEIVNDVDGAAEALDRYQAKQPEDFWEEYDWYLTLDALAEAMWQDPKRDWDDIIESLLVKM